MRIGAGVAAAVSAWGLVSVAANFAAAEPVRLADSTLQAWVSGSDFAIDAPLGSVIKVTFSPDGTLAGAAGGMGWALGAANDTGRWWVSADKLCKRWSVWFDAKTRCVEIRTQGEKIFWRDGEGREGTATRTAARPVAPPPSALAAAAPHRDPSSTRSASASQPPPHIQPAARAEPAAPAATPPADVKSKPATAPMPLKPADRAALRLVPPAPAPVARPRQAPAEPAERQASVSAWTPDQGQAQAPPPPAGPARPQPGGREPLALLRVVNVQPDDVLWVRQGPGTEHEEIGALQPNGRGIELVGPCTGDWCRIAYRGLRGWASRHYLVADGMATTTR